MVALNSTTFMLIVNYSPEKSTVESIIYKLKRFARNDQALEILN